MALLKIDNLPIKQVACIAAICLSALFFWWIQDKREPDELKKQREEVEFTQLFKDIAVVDSPRLGGNQLCRFGLGDGRGSKTVNPVFAGELLKMHASKSILGEKVINSQIRGVKMPLPDLLYLTDKEIELGWNYDLPRNGRTNRWGATIRVDIATRTIRQYNNTLYD